MFKDLRKFIEKVDELGQCKTIENADRDFEMGLIAKWQGCIDKKA